MGGIHERVPMSGVPPSSADSEAHPRARAGEPYG